MAALKFDDIPVSARAGFEQLQAKFRHGLQARWDQIEAAGTPVACAHALHRLAGAAGSLGYAELGAAARTALAAAEGADHVRSLAPALRALAACIQATQEPGRD